MARSTIDGEISPLDGAPPPIRGSQEPPRTLDESESPRGWLGLPLGVRSALVDQAAISGSNFGLNLYLARSLPPAEYGSFAVALALHFFVAAIYAGSIGDPLQVFAAGRYRARLAEYLQSMWVAHWIVSGVILAGFLAFAGLAAAGGARLPIAALAALAAIGIATPGLLLLVLSRRAAYAVRRVDLAARAALLYAASILVGVALIELTGLRAAPGALLAMGSAGLVSALYLYRRIADVVGQHRASLRESLAHLRALFAEVGGRMRWSAGIGTVVWASAEAYSLIVASFAGLAAAGAYRAVFNLTQPLAQLLTAFGGVSVTHLVGLRGRPGFQRFVHRALVMLLAAAAIYLGLLIAFGDALLELLYDGRYDEKAALWLLGVALIPRACLSAFDPALRSQERFDQVFWAFLVSSGVAVLVGSIAAARFGLEGAAATTIAANAACAWRMWVSSRRGPSARRDR